MKMPSSRAVGPPIIVVKNIDFLQSVCKVVSDRKRSKLFSGANFEQLLTFVEIAYNLLHGIFPLTNIQKRKLFPHAQTLRKLAAARTPATALRLLRSCDVDFFRALLRPVLTADCTAKFKSVCHSSK